MHDVPACGAISAEKNSLRPQIDIFFASGGPGLCSGSWERAELKVVCCTARKITFFSGLRRKHMQQQK
jgi:hypothetical protein